MFPRTMFNALPKKGASLLEEPTGENYGATSDANSTRRNSQFDSFTESAPPILEPSKDDPRPPKPQNATATGDSSSPPINPWRTLATSSCREPMTRAPVTYRDPPRDLANEKQQVEEQQQILYDQVEEHHCFCSALMNGYCDAANRIRNSKFIYFFQLLFAAIHISAIVMGIIFQSKCRVVEELPVAGALLGSFGAVFTVVWMVFTFHNRRGRCIEELQLCLLLILLTLVIFVLVDVCIFFSTSVSFDAKADHYCDETFYRYDYYKQIATGAVAVLATLLYLPAFSHWLSSC